MPLPRITATTLAAGQVDLWQVDLLAAGEALPECLVLLSPDERARAERFHFERDRRRFIAARAALRRILAGHLALRPEAVELRYTAAGKPYVLAAHTPSGTELHFNLSHSHELALCAVASFPVGVDLEHLRPIPDALELARNNFSPGEIAAIEAATPAGRSLAFLRCWTRKEAVVKACGSGLSVPLTGFTVPLEDDRPADLLWDKSPGGTHTWFLVPVAGIAGYVGAVAATQPVQHLRRLSFSA